MEILIAAIGKWSACPEAILYQEYAKRLPWSLTLKEYKAPTHSTPEKEGSWLLETTRQFGAQVCVVLDERGKPLSSEAFAHHCGNWIDAGRGRVAFLIGGHAGHSPQVRQAAEMLYSFGAATWPHMLIRPMLAEQLYRAWSILHRHPYHRA